VAEEIVYLLAARKKEGYTSNDLRSLTRSYILKIPSLPNGATICGTKPLIHGPLGILI
jgi:hypothetical protein